MPRKLLIQRNLTTATVVLLKAVYSNILSHKSKNGNKRRSFQKRQDSKYQSSHELNDVKSKKNK